MAEEKLIITPKTFRGDTSIVSARIPADLLEKIDEIAKESNRTRNEMIQLLLAYAVERTEVHQEK